MKRFAGLVWGSVRSWGDFGRWAGEGPVRLRAAGLRGAAARGRCEPASCRGRGRRGCGGAAAPARPCPSPPFPSFLSLSFPLLSLLSLPLFSLSRAEVPAEESGGPRGASLLLGLRPLGRVRSGACSPKRCVCRPSGAENWFLMLQQHINPSVQHLALYQNTEIILLFKATDVKIIFSVRSH